MLWACHCIFNQCASECCELYMTPVLSNRYDSEGKGASLAPIGAEMGATRAGSLKSMYSDRVFLSHITSDPTMGQEKVQSWMLTKYDTIYILNRKIANLYLPQFDLFFFAACFLQFVCHHKPHQAWPEHVVPCLQDLQQEGDWSFWIRILVWRMPKEWLWMLTEVKSLP